MIVWIQILEGRAAVIKLVCICRLSVQVYLRAKEQYLAIFTFNVMESQFMDVTILHCFVPSSMRAVSPRYRACIYM
jgi:hypothetical protein